MKVWGLGPRALQGLTNHQEGSYISIACTTRRFHFGALAQLEGDQAQMLIQADGARIIMQETRVPCGRSPTQGPGTIVRGVSTTCPKGGLEETGYTTLEYRGLVPRLICDEDLSWTAGELVYLLGRSLSEAALLLCLRLCQSRPNQDCSKLRNWAVGTPATPFCFRCGFRCILRN